LRFLHCLVPFRNRFISYHRFSIESIDDHPHLDESDHNLHGIPTWDPSQERDPRPLSHQQRERIPSTSDWPPPTRTNGHREHLEVFIMESVRAGSDVPDVRFPPGWRASRGLDSKLEAVPYRTVALTCGPFLVWCDCLSLLATISQLFSYNDQVVPSLHGNRN